MRVLIIGSLAGELGQAARLAMARGARLDQADGIEPALVRLRIDARVDLVLCELLDDIAALVRALASERINVPVVACGTGNDPDAAVRAIRAGAREFLPLPPDPDLIAAILEAASGETHALIVRDPAMAATVRRAEQVAGAEASVLITGESGTGKEVPGAPHPPPLAPRRRPVRRAELRRHSRQPAGVGNCSVTKRAPSPAPWPAASASSRPPTAAPCCSTRSARWTPACRPSCCVPCRAGDRPARRRGAGKGECAHPGHHQP